MPETIETREISTEERDTILKLSEGHFHDLKAQEIKPAKLSRSISAFANAAGGELYIGIDEVEQEGRKVRKWRGFDDVESANGHIQTFAELFPLGQSFSYTFLDCPAEHGLVLQAQVHKTVDVVRASDGNPYIRRGAQNIPVKTHEQLERLRMDKGVISFETRTVSAPLDVITDSYVVTDFVLNVVPRSEPEPWLRKQMLIRDDKPTVAGVVLFSDEPQAALPKRCGIKIYRYETREEEGTRDTLSGDPLSVEGCAYDQIKNAVGRTVEIVEGIQVLGSKGLEKIEYPKETLHEIITNAVLHRDYSVATDVHIRVFDNRIEVESPGTLPGHVTATNILHSQLARNGALVRMINKFPSPPNKDVGEGLNTAFEAMRKLRLKDPIIRERENSVLVLIRHEPLASPEEAVMDYLENHEEISNSIVRGLTGITSENAVKEVFYRLRDKGLLERTPGKRGSASTWRKPRDGGNGATVNDLFPTC